MSRDLEDRIALSESLAQLPSMIEAVRARDEAGVRQRLRAAVESFPRIDRASVVDRQGNGLVGLSHVQGIAGKESLPPAITSAASPGSGSPMSPTSSAARRSPGPT